MATSRLLRAGLFKFEDREECRLVSLDCSEEFLQFLATKTWNWKYSVYGKKVYINGGKRSDSQSEYNVLVLNKDASTKIVQANSGIILQHSAARLGYQKQFNESSRLIFKTELFYISIYIITYTISYPSHK